ncbi:MAG: chorismate synthase [Sphaerochaetaceae bacterium]|nr:chorismate synthase [Sphaerochaetaceae bacterium]
MAGNTFGRLMKVTTFGESHGRALGVVVDGFPAGIAFDLEFIQSEMDRRRPGANSLGTKRDEKDQIKVLSGVFEGTTTGMPICMILENENQQSKDYSEIKDLFRPSHADYTYEMKYGIRDYRGGGRSSGRETSSRVAAGALAKLFLRSKGIEIKAGTVEVAGIKAENCNWDSISNELSCPDSEKTILMKEAIEKAREERESVGGIVECHITGVPVGLGEPCFDKLSSRLAAAIMSIGACKGFEIGEGFESARMKGSLYNDQMRVEDGKVSFNSNHSGGILGGISNGNEIVFRAAFKPTPSISREQLTITKDLENTTCLIKGRHDPCIVPRAVVVVEAMAALAIMDEYLISEAN